MNNQITGPEVMELYWELRTRIDDLISKIDYLKEELEEHKRSCP